MGEVSVLVVQIRSTQLFPEVPGVVVQTALNAAVVLLAEDVSQAVSM